MLKKKDDISIFKIIKKIFPMVLKTSPINFFVMIFIGLILGTTTFLNTIFIQKFFDNATGMSVGSVSMRVTVISAFVLAFIFIFDNTVNATFNLFASYFIQKIRGTLTDTVNKKCSRVQAINFEDSNMLDNINKAHEGVNGACSIVFISEMIIVTYVPYFIFMGIYLYKLNPILILTMICVFTPVIINQFIRVKIFAKLEDNSVNFRREVEYYEKCIKDREYFKETRVLGGFKYFNKKYKTSLKLLNKEIWKSQKKANLLELLMEVLTVVGYGGILFLLFRSLMDGKITVGAFGAVLTSIGMLFALANELIAMQIGEVSRSVGTVKNFIRFLEYEEKKGSDIDVKNPPAIELKNASFSYPNSEKLILDNINLSINAKETIAIVGENGAGKSTLMKIILGIYEPTVGSVTINGYDTKEISNKSLFENTSAVFQDFKKYKFSLAENISISDSKNEDTEKINKVINEMEINLEDEKFTDGMQTILSREFGGIDLSGGQWQRIAIARGLYKFNNFIVLDEPTAAIDPIEEGKIFNKFKEISKDKTAIIVTHRMGTVKIADRIVVLDEGKISEVGTHDEIIKNNGKYKEMYQAQSKWYSFN